ncbi:CoA transferase [Micrococcus luteus]|uniref:CoA transferase n=1 Tax=Micrococcus luteus TaxID=1270 RepID=UPI00387972F5
MDLTSALDGISVVTVALNLPGPAAAARLGELGADVVTVLPPAGDPMATMSPSLYAGLHAGQRVVTVDLKSDAGRAEMEELLAAADVFITSHRAGALRRLGLDAAAVAMRHPRVCQVDIVGFAGERADVPGHDLTYQAESGLLPVDDAGTPVLPRALVADMHGAEQAVSAALGLLLARGRGGDDAVGGRAQVALADAAAAVGLPTRHGLLEPDAILGGATPYYAVYPAAEGHVAVGALEPHFAEALRAELDLLEGTGDDVAAALSAALRSRSARDWQAWGEARGIPLAEVG